MTLNEIRHISERFAADDLGFKHIIDAKNKSPRLFAKLVAERTALLCERYSVNVVEHYTQSALF